MNVLKLLLAAFEESNLLPFVAISVFLTAMVVLFAKAAIILRLQSDDTIRQSTLSNHSNLQATRLKMTRVHIPFTFRLLEIGNNSYEEVRLAVSSQIKYKLQAFWAVSIRELHHGVLWRPWCELKEASKAPKGTIVEESNCQHLAADMRNQQPHAEHVITLRSPQKPLVLGAPPRLAYPLVVFLIRDTDNDENLHPDETVVLVNVIHLRDQVCPLPTSVLAQYLKQSSGQLSCLKQLYLATGDPFSAEENSAQSLSLAEPVACSNSNEPLLCSDSVLRDGQQQQSEQLCVVCHYFPLSRALLPCRHTCICAVCFSKLDRCPMCRAPITSYFCIRTEDYLPPNALDTKATKPKGTVHWLDSLNDRLTDFLGFR